MQGSRHEPVMASRAATALIEAIEDPAAGRFFLGVQWHPEDLIAEGPHRALFAALCRAAERK